MSRKTSKVGEAEQASEVAAAALIAEKAEAEAATLAAAEALAASVAAAAVAAKEAADVVAAEEVTLAVKAVALAASEAAAVAVLRSGGKFKLSERAEEYLSVLLAQYFGAPTVEESGMWLEAVESGNQVLVRSGHPQLEITSVPFVAGDASTDLTGSNILLNVHRQLADVRLLD